MTLPPQRTTPLHCCESQNVVAGEHNRFVHPNLFSIFYPAMPPRESTIIMVSRAARAAVVDMWYVVGFVG